MPSCLVIQADADRIPALLQLVEDGNLNKTKAADEIRQLKKCLEETEQSFRQEISRIQESHRAEMESQSRPIKY